MDNKDWEPELYLKFNKERTQPSIDLVSHINLKDPSKIIDVGCGPGNSTQILFQKWPYAEITGVDNSVAMIRKAEEDYPEQNWEIIDIGKDEINETFDIVFSNAVIQWVPNHPELLKKFYRMLNSGGVLAIQIPMFWDMPLGKSIAKIASSSRWNEMTKGVIELFTIHDYAYYFDNLYEIYDSIDIWETNYMHIMDSHLAILEMIRSTGLKPFIDSLETEKDKMDFEEQVLDEIKKDYPVRKNGKVIFPFKRLFFTASRS